MPSSRSLRLMLCIRTEGRKGKEEKRREGEGEGEGEGEAKGEGEGKKRKGKKELREQRHTLTRFYWEIS
jgi:hypothetical protein